MNDWRGLITYCLAASEGCRREWDRDRSMTETTAFLVEYITGGNSASSDTMKLAV